MSINLVNKRFSNNRLTLQVEINTQIETLWFDNLSSNIINYDGIVYLLLLIAMKVKQDINLNNISISASCIKNIENIQKHFMKTYPQEKLKPIKIINYKISEVNSEKKKKNIGGFFSLGVDSHYTLLKASKYLDTIIYVNGFDVRIGDKILLLDVKHSLKSISEKFGVNLKIVSTNFRETSNKFIDWEPIHGLTLIGLASLMQYSFEKILISSSGTTTTISQSGVHQDLDHLVSNKSFKIKTFGYKVTRYKKLKYVIQQSMDKTIRVCWKNIDNRYNCGICKKCILNRLALEAINKNKEFTMTKYNYSLLFDNLSINNNYDLEFAKEILSNTKDPNIKANLQLKIKFYGNNNIKHNKWVRVKPCLFIDFNGVISMKPFWFSLQNVNHKYYSMGQRLEDFLFKQNKTIIQDWMIGKYTTESIHKLLSEKLNIQYKEILEVFIEDARNIDISDRILDKLELLRNHYYVILVTDNMDSFDLYTKPNNRRLSVVFDEIINSFSRKATKMDNNGIIFKELVKKYKTELCKSILVDDSLNNTQIFSNLGGIGKQARGEIETIKILDSLLLNHKIKWAWQY